MHMAPKAKTAFENPLTLEHKAQIEEALAVLKGLNEHITRAKQAGIDIADLEKQKVELEQKLLAIKRAYFPGS